MIDDPMDRIAAALERMAPVPLAAPDFDVATAFVWQTDPDRLEPVESVSRVDLTLLVGIDRSRGHAVTEHAPVRRWFACE